MAILGIDEVGRGPWAGPLVVGAVILPEAEQDWYADLADSKKLSPKKRENLSELISASSATGLGWVSSSELDEFGLSKSLKLAAARAVKSVQSLRVPFSQIVIDGKVNFLAGTPLEKYVSTLVKADGLIRAVSAASIIAKVARDRYMVELAAKYPEYGFETHVGYGTAAHRAALGKFGVTPEHRLSFEPCKSLTGFQPHENVVKNTTKIGTKGETAVAEYLVRHGHTILARNHKTPFYEIDIISTLNNKIYFTEVKYRKNDFAGGGLAAIDEKKQQKMCYAAESFLKFKPEFKTFDPILAVADVAGDDFVVQEWFPLV